LQVRSAPFASRSRPSGQWPLPLLEASPNRPAGAICSLGPGIGDQGIVGVGTRRVPLRMAQIRPARGGAVVVRGCGGHLRATRYHHLHRDVAVLSCLLISCACSLCVARRAVNNTANDQPGFFRGSRQTSFCSGSFGSLPAAPLLAFFRALTARFTRVERNVKPNGRSGWFGRLCVVWWAGSCGRHRGSDHWNGG
jgi:hypothetical protein